MKCPNCKESKLVLSERKGIEIDYCPECRGIWLDRGELDKILERSREDSQESRSSHSPAEVRHSHYPHYKRKKSFLEELFD